MRQFLTATGLILTLIQAVPAYAEGETDQTAMAGHDMSTMGAADGPATKDYQAAMDTMMTNMMVPYTGNPDVDFVAGMMPHHQGAVDMAKIVLQYGTDPEVKKFAEGVIAAQEAEITWMKEWLAKQPK